MKHSFFSILGAFARGAVRGKRKEAVAMETYLHCIPSIQKLIDRHQLGINLKERVVALDIQVHLAFLPRVFTPSGIAKADKRYAAFFDKVVAFMNFEMGRRGIKDFIDPEKEAIQFVVTSKERTVVDKDGNMVPVHMQVQERTVLVGLYKNGVVNYREYGEEEMKEL